MKKYYVILLLMACACVCHGQPKDYEPLSVYGPAAGSKVTIDFKSPQRGVLSNLSLYLKGPKDIVVDSIFVSVIGRDEVSLDQLESQSMGRHGDAYGRHYVGKANAEKTGKDMRLFFEDIDLRVDNGADLRLTICGIDGREKQSLQASATWQMSTPPLSKELQGKAYVEHDPQKTWRASAKFKATPAISRAHYDARKLGLKGDGATDETKKLNIAIEKLSKKGGGIIDFKDGIFLMRTVHLRSHVWLHVENDATLLAIAGMDEPEATWFAKYSSGGGSGTLDTSPYEEPDNHLTKQDVGHSFFNNAMFVALRQEDIRIYGQGRISGNDVLETDNDVMENALGRRADKMMSFKLCRDIEVGGEDCPDDMWYDEQNDRPAYLTSGGRLSNKACDKMLDIDQAGHFVILATGTDNIRVHDINCGRISINRARDILDFMQCRDVEVRNVYSKASGDDIVKLGSDCSLGFTRKSYNIMVRNIVGDTHCNLFQIGSETADDITDVYVDNIYALAADKAAFSISSNDGGTVARIHLNSGKTGTLHHRSKTFRTRTPLFLSVSGRGRTLGAKVGEYGFNEKGTKRHELLAQNISLGKIEDVSIAHIDCSEIYAGSSCYRDKRWIDYDGTQAESALIIAGFQLPQSDKVDGGLDFVLPDGRMKSYVSHVKLDDVRVKVKGGHPEKEADNYCPELGIGKFNIGDMKKQPSYGLWCRHAKDLTINRVSFSAESHDGRPAIILDDVENAKRDGNTIK